MVRGLLVDQLPNKRFSQILFMLLVLKECKPEVDKNLRKEFEVRICRHDCDSLRDPDAFLLYIFLLTENLVHALVENEELQENLIILGPDNHRKQLVSWPLRLLKNLHPIWKSILRRLAELH